MDELNKLRSLTQLVIMRNPVMMSMTEDTARFVIIAKIAKIDSLNRSEVPLKKSCWIITFHSSHRLQNNLLVQITWQERKGAELDYLKKYGKEWKSSGGDQDPKKNNPSDDFLHRHPRYLDLVESPCQRQAKSATDLKFVIGSFWFCFQNTDHQKIQN